MSDICRLDSGITFYVWCLPLTPQIIIKDELVSQPYVDMTVKLMQRFGVKVELVNGLQHMKVRVQMCVHA